MCIRDRYKKRPDGRYLSQISTGLISEDGKPIYKNVYADSPSALDKAVSDLRLQRDKGINIANQDVSFFELADIWIQTYKSTRSYNTKRMYQNTLNLYILPALGDYKVKDIRKTNLQLLINKMAEKGLTRSIEIVKVTLNQIFEMAIDEDIIFKNPTRGLVFPKQVKPSKRSLTEEETKLILTCPLELKERAFVSTLYYTGIRRGEIIALSKNDINLEKKELQIKNAVSFEHNRSILKAPKSIAAVRKIPIPDDLFSILKEYYEQTKSFFLFPSGTDEIMTETVLKRFWKRIIGRINIYAGGNEKIFAISKDISMHIFRHNYTTILRRSGVDAKTAQVLLGHESIKMMLEVYDHISDADVSLATDKINQFSKLTQSKLSQK